MKHLLLLALQVAPLALANGQQSLDAICDTAHSLALRQSARDAFDKHQYQVAALHFSEALQEGRKLIYGSLTWRSNPSGNFSSSNLRLLQGGSPWQMCI